MADTPGESAAHSEDRQKRGLTDFQIAVLIMVGIASLSVVVAALRITDQAVYRTVEEREAPNRFLDEQLRTLRLIAKTSSSAVPARLYLGIDDCFRRSAPLPFDESLARSALIACADTEIGALRAQGGARMAEEGEQVLHDAGINVLVRH